jgi:hypothetical protein
VRQFQKILFIIAVFMLGVSIWYYVQLENPVEKEALKIISPIKEDVPDRVTKEFDVRDYGFEGEEAEQLTLYFKDVKKELSDILARDEMVVISLTDFKTEDPYRQKLYMALSLTDHLKVITRRTCDKLSQKLAEAESSAQQKKITSSPEYIVCFPGKW